MTYCINLENEDERRKTITTSFDSTDIQIEFIEAVDTRGEKWKRYTHYLTEKAIDEINVSVRNGKRKHHHELTPGAVGCFISHIKCWKTFLSGNPKKDDILFVLEDDSVAEDGFMQEFPSVLHSLPQDTDIFLMSRLTNEHYIHQKQDVYSFYKFKKSGYFYYLNAYIITQSGIQKILKNLEKTDSRFEKQIDSYLSDMLKDGMLNIYCTQNDLCTQKFSSPTSIQIIPLEEDMVDR